jgi:nucleotide-binding universal stress UspA family protein
MYERILVPVDGSETSNRGLAEAISLAKLCGAQLRLIHVIDELSFAMTADAYGSYAGELIQALREGGEKVLARCKAEVEAAGLTVDAVLRDQVGGRVCDLVVAEAQSWAANLIVLGTHGRRGVGRVLLGSDAERIVRQASVPVLLVRST